MCVIIVKPSGEEMPDETTLWQCWQVNPDGAGYMYQHNDKVVVSKGYMHLGDLEIALEEISHIVKNTTLVIRLEDTGNSVFGWKLVSGNPYPSGSVIIRGLPEDSDFLFRTYGMLAQ